MDGSDIIRVFPRRTKATPSGPDVVIGRGPGLFDHPTAVRISVAFTWDLPLATDLQRQWQKVAPTSMGGPACGDRGTDFVPGLNLKPGYVITSRGCPNKCWFCSVWRREGHAIRELPITQGHNVLDDNLLACSDDHIARVFDMLKNQSEPAQFTGGLEAARLTDHHVNLLANLNPKQMFFAYDTPDDLEPLQTAGKKLLQAFTKASHKLRAYVLVGAPNDSFDKATHRLRQTWDAGFFPMAMLYRNQQGHQPIPWKQFQRTWANPFITASNLKQP